MAGWLGKYKENALGTLGTIAEGITNLNKFAQDPVGRLSEIAQQPSEAMTAEDLMNQAMSVTPMGAGTLVKVGPGTGLAENVSKLLHITPTGEKLAEIVDRPSITGRGKEALGMISKGKPDEELMIPMSEFMSNPQTYEIMDAARQAAQKSSKVPSELSKLKDTMISLRNMPKESTLGSFTPTKDEIMLNLANLHSPEEITGTLLHEGQHKVQQYQGLPQGASMDYFSELKKNVPKLKEIYRNYPEFQDILHRLEISPNALGYLYSKGEADAYSTELRQLLSEAQRAEEPLHGRYLKLAEKHGWKLDPSKFIETPMLLEAPTYQSRMRIINGFRKLLGGK
jgi:hypothetical protein